MTARIFAIIALAAMTKATAQQRNPSNWQDLRLTDAVVPESYDLAVSIDPDSESFSGKVRIALKVSRPVKTLVLHSLGLELKDAVPSARVALDAETETAAFSLDEPLAPGPAVFEAAFSGKLNKTMQGLYLSTEKREGRVEKYAFSQFEPTDARRMFPSFDEPGFKAKFNLTVTAPEGLTILSNAEASTRAARGGLQTVVFKESPRMSTYLLALFAARLSGGEARKTAGTELRAWATPEKLPMAAFAMDEGTRGLQLLLDYFEVPYPLPKMDIIAVPDFNAGAMENWGAVTFRDTAMLADRKLASTNALRRISVVVVHEFVHQWFGDLVTMKWWNDLWLNESFATWLSYKIVDRMRPEWHVWFEFEDGKALPLRLDSLKSARPIISPAVTSAEIEAQFDGMSYQKGAAILRMLENDLGEEPFRRGIKTYLTRHQYGNAEASDFWKALEEASGRPVAKIAQDWLAQTGFPLVQVKAEGLTLTVSQSPFSAYGASRDKKAWNVPLVISYQLEGEDEVRVHRVLLRKGAARTAVALPGKGRLLWAYPNHEQSGYYRVSLSKPLAAALLRNARLEVIEKTGYLSDLWAQARNGTLPISSFMDALEVLGRGDDRPLVEAVAGYLVAARELLALDAADQKRLGGLAQDLLGPHWKRLGWTAKAGEDDDAKLSRLAVLSALGKVAEPKTLIAENREKLASYLKDPGSLDPTLVGAVLALAARNGGSSLFDTFAARMKAAAVPQDRDRFMAALAEFKDQALARRLMDLALSDDIRPQDLWRPVGALLANRAVQKTAWEALKARWKDYRTKAGAKGSVIMVKGAELLISRAWLKDVGSFFAAPDNRVPEADRALKQTLEKIELNVGFQEKQSKALSRWLRAREG